MNASDRPLRTFRVFRAVCGQLPVVLGAAPARVLHELSFADVLDEASDTGYQRPFDAKHAREFRAYIEAPGATTIPLTFNLRGPSGDAWTLTPSQSGLDVLTVRCPGPEQSAVMARVDCQHRLGMMADSSVELTFQCFLGLSSEEEMAIFNVINGKAKGLSSSLLDYHTTKLVEGYERSQLELFIAKKLNEDPESVWVGAVTMGGQGSQGSRRRTSLRGLQSATKLMLKNSPLGSADLSIDSKYRVVCEFWHAVATTWPDAWRHPRKHLVTKGVGVNALSLVAADVLTACLAANRAPTREVFEEYLRPLSSVDWSSSGAFKGYGGRNGATRLHELLRSRLFATERLLRAAR